MIYVSPFTLAAMLIGSNADTNWGGILIGVVVGCAVSALWVALRKAFKTAEPEFKAVFSDQVVAKPRKRKPVLGQWWDVTGREVGDSPQLEAPQSMVVASSEKGVNTK